MRLLRYLEELRGGLKIRRAFAVALLRQPLGKESDYPFSDLTSRTSQIGSGKHRWYPALTLSAKHCLVWWPNSE